MPVQIWDLWYPKAAATGLPFARALVDETDAVLAHAVPDFITASVEDEFGKRLAFGKDLLRTLQSPICLLRRQGETLSREDIWPDASHIGMTVILPGGEAAMLKSWWNADDRQEWRWQIELYNSIRPRQDDSAAR